MPLPPPPPSQSRYTGFQRHAHRYSRFLFLFQDVKLDFMLEIKKYSENFSVVNKDEAQKETKQLTSLFQLAFFIVLFTLLLIYISLIFTFFSLVSVSSVPPSLVPLVNFYTFVLCSHFPSHVTLLGRASS